MVFLIKNQGTYDIFRFRIEIQFLKLGGRLSISNFESLAKGQRRNDSRKAMAFFRFWDGIQKV